MNTAKLIKKAEENGNLNHNEIKTLLGLTSQEEIKQLFESAYRVKVANVGRKVWFRGIIEFSNICTKDCYYCGIRKSNQKIARYIIPEQEIINSALWCWKAQYGSVVLQSGERNDPDFIDMVERIIREIKLRTNGELGLTLCLGEQSEETYKRWFLAGAHRYLLRIETSNPELYAKLHPSNHSYLNRVECLHRLRRVGYQVGTGVMIGLPMQTLDHLADDILFFKNMDIDMIGMGPFLFHSQTPLNEYRNSCYKSEEELLEAGLKMIAVARLVLRDVNIAATTALQALKHNGRELGLQAGANVIMPNATDTRYRESYKLYENKPCIDENASMCRDCLISRIKKIGETVGFGGWGDSPHFKKKMANR